MAHGWRVTKQRETDSPLRTPKMPLPPLLWGVMAILSADGVPDAPPVLSVFPVSTAYSFIYSASCFLKPRVASWLCRVPASSGCPLEAALCGAPHVLSALYWQNMFMFVPVNEFLSLRVSDWSWLFLFSSTDGLKESSNKGWAVGHDSVKGFAEW